MQKQNFSSKDKTNSNRKNLNNITNKYLISLIFDFIEKKTVCGITIGNRGFAKDIFRPAFKTVFKTVIGIMDEVPGYPEYSMVIYNTVKFIAERVYDNYNQYQWPITIPEKFRKVKKEKSETGYLGEEAKPYAIKVIMYILLFELISLGRQKKLHNKARECAACLQKPSKSNPTEFNEWINELIYFTVYRALMESLNEISKEERSGTLDWKSSTIYILRILERLEPQNKNCEFDLIISNAIEHWIKLKFEFPPIRDDNLMAILCFWYIKVIFEENKPQNNDERKKNFNLALECFIKIFGDITISRCISNPMSPSHICLTERIQVLQENSKARGLLYKLLKKDESFSFLFQDKDEKKKEEISQIPEQESKMEIQK